MASISRLSETVFLLIRTVVSSHLAYGETLEHEEVGRLTPEMHMSRAEMYTESLGAHGSEISPVTEVLEPHFVS
jgi:hypothetical protein